MQRMQYDLAMALFEVMYYPTICIEEMRNTVIHCCQVRQSLSQALNWGSP